MARRSQQGISLIEVLIAGVVVSMGVLAAAALQGRALQATDHALRSTQVLQLAQGMLETVRARGRLSASDVPALQRNLQAVAGATARVRVQSTAEGLALDLQWQEAGFAIVGRLAP